MNKYSYEVIQKCEFLFVDGKLNFSEISKKLGSKPTASTIAGWAAKRDPNGINWFDKKLEKRISFNENFLPEQIAEKIQEKMKEILSKSETGFTLNEAKSLATLHKIVNEIKHAKFSIPYVIYSLRILTDYLKKNFPELLTEKFVKAIIQFIDKLEKDSK